MQTRPPTHSKPWTAPTITAIRSLSNAEAGMFFTIEVLHLLGISS